jgi:hypothetical protein
VGVCVCVVLMLRLAGSKTGGVGANKMLSPPGQRLPEWRVWSNELQEEMHQRRRDRRRPPGQVDKLPSSWSVTLNAALPV